MSLDRVRVGLLFFLAIFLIGVGIEFYRDYQQLESIHQAAVRGLAVDARIHFPGGFNLVLVFLFLAVAFGKRFHFAFGLSLAYFLLLILATYNLVQGCFLGEDICPPSTTWTKVTLRFEWFDWVSWALVPVTCCVTLWLVVMVRNNRREQV